MARPPRLLHPRQSLQRAAQLFAADGHHLIGGAGTFALFFEAMFAMQLSHPARPPP